jgi:hypothetical protein
MALLVADDSEFQTQKNLLDAGFFVSAGDQLKVALTRAE